MKLKLWKKLALALALAVAVPSAPFIAPQTVIEAQAASINSSEVTLTIGDTYKLKLSGVYGTTTWKSKNTSVAKVNKKGKVTAIAAGTARIVAKNNGKKYKCTVTVVSAAEPSTTGTPVNTVVYNQGGIKITYLGLENASNIYYKANFNIENTSSQNVYVSSTNSSIDGYMYSVGSLGKVLSGKNAVGYFHLSRSGMSDKGIDPDNFKSMEFQFHIYDADTYKDIIKASDAITINF